MRKEVLRLSRACGVVHPTLVTSDHLEIIDDRFRGQSVSELFAFDPRWGSPLPAERAAIEELMREPSGIPRHAAAAQVPSDPIVAHAPPARG